MYAKSEIISHLTSTYSLGNLEYSSPQGLSNQIKHDKCKACDWSAAKSTVRKVGPVQVVMVLLKQLQLKGVNEILILLIIIIITRVICCIKTTPESRTCLWHFLVSIHVILF